MILGPVAGTVRCVLAGCFYAAAVLVGVAASVKHVEPAARARVLGRLLPLVERRGLGRVIARVVGVAELGVAIAALGWSSSISAALLTVGYLAFAAVAARLIAVAAGTDCGCFGAVTSPVRPVHVAANLVGATIAATGIAWPSGTLPQVLADQPWSGVPFTGAVLLLSWLGYLTFTALPDLLAAQAEAD
jgi:hypothetical protein